QDFDGNLAVVLEILGEVDGRHSTLPKLTLEAIAVGESGLEQLYRVSQRIGTGIKTGKLPGVEAISYSNFESPALRLNVSQQPLQFHSLRSNRRGLHFVKRRFNDGNILLRGATAYSHTCDHLTVVSERHSAAHGAVPTLRDHNERIEWVARLDQGNKI